MQRRFDRHVRREIANNIRHINMNFQRTQPTTMGRILLTQLRAALRRYA